MKSYNINVPWVNIKHRKLHLQNGLGKDKIIYNPVKSAPNLAGAVFNRLSLIESHIFVWEHNQWNKYHDTKYVCTLDHSRMKIEGLVWYWCKPSWPYSL